MTRARGKERGIHAASSPECRATQAPPDPPDSRALKRHECRAPGRNRLSLTNRQRFRRVDLRVLRPMLRPLLEAMLGPKEFDMSICFLSSRQMSRLNESFLRHAGPTDVLAFDYCEPDDATLRGEIFVCVEVAVSQARRFGTRWQSEMVRYIIHGLLHLLGYDDHEPAARRRMKREEDRILHALGRRFRPGIL